MIFIYFKFTLFIVLLFSSLFQSHNLFINNTYEGPKFIDSQTQINSNDLQISNQSAKRYEYPFIALVTNYEKQCGGAFVRRNIVLTAAHCLYKDPSKNLGFKVFLHRFNLLENQKEEGALELDVKEVVIHPKYEFIEKSGAPNDLAILILENEKAEYKGVNLDFILLIDNNNEFNQINEQVYLLGWGAEPKNYQKGITQPTKVLKQMELKLIDDNNCNYIGYKKGSNLCGLGKTNNDIPCKGDSGSPLFHPNTNKKGLPTLVGLLSFGSPKCDSSSVFVNISYYNEFISFYINKYYNEIFPESKKKLDQLLFEMNSNNNTKNDSINMNNNNSNNNQNKLESTSSLTSTMNLFPTTTTTPISTNINISSETSFKTKEKGSINQLSTLTISETLNEIQPTITTTITTTTTSINTSKPTIITSLTNTIDSTLTSSVTTTTTTTTIASSTTSTNSLKPDNSFNINKLRSLNIKKNPSNLDIHLIEDLVKEYFKKDELKQFNEKNDNNNIKLNIEKGKR